MFTGLSTPRVGLEPTTLRLTAECSAIELSRIISLKFYIPSKPHTDYNIFLPFCKHPTGRNLIFPLLPSSGQALDRLVTVSSMHCCTSTPTLSTSSSSRGLTSLKNGISHLEGGFTLRCLQRLSLPGLATLPWLWQTNRYTSGPSIPVLSY